MSVLRTIRRSVNTAIKLPLAMAWDVISLGNMGEGASSTTRVLREHQARKTADDWIEVAEVLREIAGKERP